MPASGRLPRLVTLCLAVMTGAAVTATGTAAAPATSASFYDPPSPLPPGENGDIIRHEPSEFFLDPLKTLPARADVQRIMYRSTDTHGEPMAVTGTVLTPHAPWLGTGERPIIGYAVGTQGQGDQCAPSKLLAAGKEYEGLFLKGLLARGYGIAITDYEGLGTPGTHTYTNRASQAHAVLDAIRAAQRLDESGLPDDGPVATSGYSQGGGASAAAAELQADYAPELDFRGSYAGAVPADLGAVATFLDGSLYFGFTGYAINSLEAAYPAVNTDEILNERGERLLDEVEQQCVGETVARYPFTESSTLTEDGRTLSAYLGEEPYAAVLAEQHIGNRAPEAPVLVAHSFLDDTVPYEQGRSMARAWCEAGATVRFSTYSSPTHAATAAAAFPEAFAFLEGRFAGLPAPDNCGTF
ncbi:lipase family protein [Haloactinomyces albus]|uniref:Dienelactone hydrolase n=1 Tax=Haloactinomyces albus TaxID=1352928 RepID=A0AAE3ZC67_9ACTN|nr:lipase family protein [Haloactinomyces albus]MDR7300434.1 dienelactone hydrolase [Haloactinomyces albus]